MNFIKKHSLLILVICIMTGCTKSNISAEDVIMKGPESTKETISAEDFERKPLFEENEEPESQFDWEQVDADVVYLFDDKDYYPLGVEMTYEVNEKKKEIKLMWILQDEATEEDAMEYATELVRKFNNILATQSTEIQVANTTDFGTLWKMFDLSVRISKEDGTAMIDKIYKAGETIDLELPTYSEGGPIANPEVQMSPGNK